MKKFFALAFMMLIFLVSCGDDDPVSPKDKLSISANSAELVGSTSTDYLESGVSITNTSDETISLTVSANLSGIASGHSATICVNSSCDKNKTTSFDSQYEISLGPGATTSSNQFNLKIYPMLSSMGSPVAGNGIVEFTFGVKGSDETIKFTVNYNFEAPMISLHDYDTDLSGYTAFEQELITYALVKNESSEEIQVEVKIVMLDLYEGHSATLCTELCYPPKTEDYIAPGKLVLASQATSSEGAFSGHIYPFIENPNEAKPGAGKVRYEFSVVGKPHHKIYYDVNYNFQ